MSKNLFLASLLGLLLFTACVSRPQYTSEPVVLKKDQGVVSEESTQKSISKVDKAKMGGIIDSYLGVPYQFGGKTRKGMDCSGLVSQVYREYAGFSLPHDTKKLYRLVTHIDRDDLVYGDLVFFSDGWFSVSHVGIYVGDAKFVHSTKGFGVIVSSLDEDYYEKRYRGARRVIP